ncbi:YbjN domain-containing protein [Buchananella hordeovulneris]|uniref:Uncharacterized protein n=1 Tax=Buchananella hordeovulneris TaxID=52770 RepID=A0A1Q5PYQ1_9ACTO|nr:YbjN domain-containing protein [Buchananella hordeovulneris]MDO5080220.1 YbjN domain-containing protein [Buchananella hordeovulneris]OKL52753.1 hypothetical protein BSZ40_01205 [Buchananella hordeovulneris]RRD43848.1 YbjN domain-containing protein [Buchananella hordeovulneris]RRD51994.1 YbjN domain-containing protein [Buchananella hordeovulneris]
MGFWDNNEAAPNVDTVRPFTRERMADWMRSKDYNFSTDDDGDVITSFGNHRFLLMANGADAEVLTVRGRWAITAPASARYKILEAINQWSIEKIWPKAYVVVDDNGTLFVSTEVSVDLEKGVSDKQLGQYLSCGIGTAIQLFEELDRLFPDTRFGPATPPPNM